MNWGFRRSATLQLCLWFEFSSTCRCLRKRRIDIALPLTFRLQFNWNWQSSINKNRARKEMWRNQNRKLESDATSLNSCCQHAQAIKIHVKLVRGLCDFTCPPPLLRIDSMEILIECHKPKSSEARHEFFEQIKSKKMSLLRLHKTLWLCPRQEGNYDSEKPATRKSQSGMWAEPVVRRGDWQIRELGRKSIKID